jgi:hypothetical protein
VIIKMAVPFLLIFCDIRRASFRENTRRRTSGKPALGRSRVEDRTGPRKISESEDTIQACERVHIWCQVKNMRNSGGFAEI